MATYQGMPYIIQQLNSIIVHLAADDEVVISDNGSTDGTLEYLQSAAEKDTRIRLLSFPDPKGVLPNFQNALAHCRGDIIFLSDQDDIWKDNKMDRISSLFAANPKLLAVQADAELIDANNQQTSTSFFAVRQCGPGVWKNFKKNTWQGCSMAFRRSLLDVVLPFPRKIPMHDVWIGMLADLAGEVLFLPEVLASYRRHSDNQSGDKPAGWRKVILWRLHLARAVLAKMPVARKFEKKNDHKIAAKHIPQ